MALPRVIVGPFAGVLAYSLGWTAFFVLTVPIAIPDCLMLHRFVPLARARRRSRTARGRSKPAHPRRDCHPRSDRVRGLAGVAIAWTGVLGGMADSGRRFLPRSISPT